LSKVLFSRIRHHFNRFSISFRPHLLGCCFTFRFQNCRLFLSFRLQYPRSFFPFSFHLLTHGIGDISWRINLL